MNYGVSDIALIEVAQILHPLTTLNTPAKVLAFFEKLGYKMPASDLLNALTPVVGRIQDVISSATTLLEATTDEEKLEAAVPLLLAAKAALDELIKVENAIRSAAGLPQNFINNAPLDQLPKRLLDYLIFQSLRQRYPRIFGTLLLMGILDEEVLAEDNAIFQSACKLKVVHWERLPRYLSEPGAVINEVYKWNTDLDSDLLLTKFEVFTKAMALSGGLYTQSDTVKNALGNTTPGLLEVRMPVFSQGFYPTTFTEFGINITPAAARSGLKKGLAIIPYFDGTAVFDFELDEYWEATLTTNIDIDAGLGLVLRPPFSLQVLQNLFNSPTAAGTLNSELVIQQITSTAEEFFIFGDKDNTHLSASGISARFYGSSNASGQDAGAELEIKTVDLLITTGEGDAFLSQILPAAGINATFEAGIGFSLSNGVYFKGSAGIEIYLPTHIQLGPVEIEGITIAIKPEDGEIPIEVSSTIKGDLGVLQFVVENIGVSSRLSFPTDGDGNVGPMDVTLGFKPPNGLGLTINAGAVIGGGYLFFDFENEEYAGAMELTIVGLISVKAIGLITTKMPDGSEGFSMLVIITAEFMPPFQLGYGFTLIGVGGLLGLNRTVLLDPLRDGVRTGSVDSIMFPQDIIANAPRIISDLKTIFPPYEGKFLIGPMAKMGWGTPTLISLSFGLIIEIPGNIAILGVLKVALPEERIPIVQIQVAFVGTLDFEKQMLTFDASLYESFILMMTLEGDMAVRLQWGDDPDFILTVGGFHPSYTPPPLALPTLRRLAINILDTSVAYIRVECYQAVTSNTVQFGANAELSFELAECSIDGHIGFDALFQFSPFYFIIELSSSFALKAIGIDLMSVRVKMSLEGPTPWRAKGTGSVSLLFIDISADVDITWGDTQNTALPDIEILPLFIVEINKSEQWNTVLSTAENLLVSLRTFEVTDTPPLVLHPSGSLVIQQKLLPLTVSIDKVGNQKTSDVQKITISAASSGSVALEVSDVEENFALAQYQEMSDAEKLSTPSFEKMPAGVSVTMGTESIKNGNMVRKKVAYEITIIDKEPRKPLRRGVLYKQVDVLFGNFLKGNSVSKSVLSKNYLTKLQPFDGKVAVMNEGYTVAFQKDNKAFGSKATFNSQMGAQTYMQAQITKNPALKKEIHIVPNYELQEL